ncbi:hypothetical protein ACX0HA_00250 [Flavobacterium hauense]
MDRNKRVTIFLTLVALSIIAGIGFTIYLAIGFTKGFANTASAIHAKEVDSKDTIATLNRDINDLKAYALRYEPISIDFSENDTLNMFDLEYIYSRRDKESIGHNDDIANIMLLKLYLSHLKKYHQGYDLISMRRGQAKYIIDYYVKLNGIDTTVEMYNTGHIYKTIKTKKNNSRLVVDYLKSIEPEQKKIEDYFKELKKKNK